MTTSDMLRQYHRRYDERVRVTVQEAVRAVPAFARRLESAGVRPDSVSDVGALSSLPILTKDDLLLQQREAPPFGGWVSADAKVRRIYQSPGPIYEPQLEGPDPWRSRRALEAAGFGAGDVVLNCFGYHLTPAGAMFEEGCFALGAAVVAAGIGSKDLQAGIIADAGVTAYTGLPSYLKSLIERYDDLGLPSERWGLTKASVSAEPLSTSLRAELARRVPNVLMSYGTAETGLLGYEDRPGGGMAVPDDVLVQICDLDTGLPVTEGEGQVVVTVFRPDYPLVRFGTGDLSAWTAGPDGEPRLAGILGRVGQAVKIRGMFLHPVQASSALAEVDGVHAFRFVVDLQDHIDSLRCEIVPSAGLDPSSTAAVADRAAASISAALRFRCAVEVVESIDEDSPVVVDERRWD